MKKTTSKALFSFLTGIAIGSVLGILFAPDKGIETRGKIKRKSEELTKDVTHSLSQQVENIKQHINDFISEMRTKYGHLESEVKQKAREQRNVNDLTNDTPYQSKTV
jgi:gas vesicle protein